MKDSRDLGSFSLGLTLVLLVGALVLFVAPPLSTSGLWDPYELNVADLARRVAINLHDASSLSLSDADNSLPHLNDLGRPQAAFTAMALGFKWFGLHDWSGRVPLALIGLLGAVATYAFLARMADRKTGVFAAVVLLTTPLYFVQARTMLGDIVPMAALAMSFGGLLAAAAVEDDKRIAWLGVGVLGLFLGFTSRGAIIGVAVPTLSVGITCIIAGYSPKRNVLGFGIGALCIAAGSMCAVRGYRALEVLEAKSDLSPWIGAMIRPPSKYPTFDIVLGHVGHAMAPWSAFLPFAVGRMFRTPPVEQDSQKERESVLRVGVLVGTAVTLLAHGGLAARTDMIAFSGPVFTAAIVAICLRDFERGAPPSLVGGIVTTIFLALFHHDFHGVPDKAFQAFGIVGTTTFPETFKDRSYLLWTIALIGFAAVVIFSFLEREPEREPFEPKNYSKILEELRTAWDGSLQVGYFASVCGASIAALGVWYGVRSSAKWLPSLNPNARLLAMNAWWFIALAPFLVIFGAYFAADLWLWMAEGSKPLRIDAWKRGLYPLERVLLLAKRPNKDDKGEDIPLGDDTTRLVGLGVLGVFAVLAVPLLLIAVVLKEQGALLEFFSIFRRSPRLLVAVLALPGLAIAALLFPALRVLGDALRTRSALVAFAGAAFGLLLNAAYFPALANQLSPKDVFDTYRKNAAPGEPLALYGVGGRTSAYYAGSQPLVHQDTDTAFQWLTGGGKRYLAMKGDELARVNQMFRKRLARNVPVVDGRSSQIMLLGSEALANDQNPLNRIVMNEPPKLQRSLDVNLDDRLQVLGMDITDSDGKITDTVSALKTYHIKTYYKVIAPLQSEWEAFIHIDGYKRRHNGDHKPCSEGTDKSKYPMLLWLAGDIIVDDYVLKLEPNFTQGDYQIYFGFWLGESRLKVKTGPQDGENRINGGVLHVK
jgi:hypothetical protein